MRKESGVHYENVSNLITFDKAHVWHPSSQMKDYERFPPLPIRRAQGSYFELFDGSKVLDAIASWWCKSLGHGHPRLRQALIEQASQFEHVILANTTHAPIVDLSRRIAGMTKHLDKVFYASDGSSALEIALKMSLHTRIISGQTQRHSFMALEHGYHGETLLTSALSDVPEFRSAYKAIMPPNMHLLRDIPYVTSRQDPLWADCSAAWPAIEKQLSTVAAHLSALVVEPIVQGAGGLRIYSADFLSRLRAWCTEHEVHLIADEIMTGFGRTGLPLACDHAGIEADFLCMAKGLTAGWLPMSVVATHNGIYDACYDDYESGKSFLHSHTHSGNALAAAVAVACFTVMETEGIYDGLPLLEQRLLQGMQAVQDATGVLKNLRGIGGIVAADLDLPESAQKQRWGYAVYQEAVKLGALLRPIGNTLYWLPPLNIAMADIDRLQDITVRAMDRVPLPRRG